MELWTALLIGFLGSFHCVGMCGPIALALPGTDDSLGGLLLGRTVYNAGRILTYAFMGLAMGAVGYSMAFAGWQQGLSVFLGLLIIAGALISLPGLGKMKRELGVKALYSWIKKAINRLFRRNGQAALLGIGLLNGLLPCGFVYMGLAGAVTTGSALAGAQYMALFGLGTVPAMMVMALAPRLISLPLRRKINRALPVLTVIFGAYLIARGLLVSDMIS